MFKSFFSGGFECATGFNRRREWIDQIEATGHEERALEDYELLASAGIRTVREGIRWPLVDLGGSYDFSSVEPFVEAARDCGTEVIWDLFHYGYPAELDPFSDQFVLRFEKYCAAVGKYLNDNLPGPHYFTPVNEPSYFSWAGAEVGEFNPHLTGRGRELKRPLCRAAIRGIEALWESAPGCRIVNVDPLCRVTRPYDRPDLAAAVRDYNHCIVFESWDIIGGRMMPELGGSPRHLDIVGINYYTINQWSLTEPGPLADEDPRRIDLRSLVRTVYDRYGCDLMISETSHSDDARPRWLAACARSALELRLEGVPLHGICLYPILGMPEWHDRSVWSRYGVWDIDHEDGFHRLEHRPSLEALAEAQDLIESAESLNGGAAGREAPSGAWPHLAAASEARRDSGARAPL